ncbi:SDR family oxidoreductase [Muricoccus radiodurans]|uniref:SDR family oxidoreductase n=1 Tax=Muricoccus radiodurans TaxID=2231721 RepID=UPI003CFAFB3A
MTRTVLVFGGLGVFGRHLVDGLVRSTDWRVIVASRRDAALPPDWPADRVSHRRLDAARATSDDLRATGAFAVVDAAGPFQAGGYGLPRACIAARLHYLDLADARDFVAGFGALDAEARAAGIVALTGVSSTPALSHAALDRLTQGWQQVDTVEIAIAPGNQAPRGLSVIRAILSYAGRPVRVWLDGRWTERPGWGLTVRREIPGLGRRWLSLCETPDLDLVPVRFHPRRAALFRAGLELSFLHLGLAALSLSVRAGWPRSLLPFAGAFRRAADAVAGLGSARGGMIVEAHGLDTDGNPAEARWVLLAEGGDGPKIPTVATLAALRALSDGRLPAGAGPCVGLLPLDAIEAELPHPNVTTCVVHRNRAPLFARALGSSVAAMPAAVQRLHEPGWWLAAAGRARVDGPTTRLAGLVARLFGFPPASDDTPVRVTIAATDIGEHWVRDFGGRRFESRLRPGMEGGLRERFGPFTFDLDVPCDASGLRMAVRGWRLGPIPLPRMLAPVSDASETVDAEGRFRFDVTIGLPLGLGRMVRYRGWLVPGA